MPELGDLGRGLGIQSKCGAAQLATARLDRRESGQDVSALGLDDGCCALRGCAALDERCSGLGLGERIRQATGFWGHPNGVGQRDQVAEVW